MWTPASTPDWEVPRFVDILEAIIKEAGIDPTPLDFQHLQTLPAGMRAVWVKRKETPLDHMIPDATIHELAELLPVLDGWYPGRRM